VSETRFVKPHVVNQDTSDPREIGYFINSADAGFVSVMEEPACLGSLNVCIWNASSSGQRVEDWQGVANNGAAPVFIQWDSGAGGLLESGEEENRAGYAVRISPVQPTAIAPLVLTANRLNDGVRIDAQVQIVSIGNNTGGNSPNFLLNNPDASVLSFFDESISGSSVVAAPWAATAVGGTVEHANPNMTSGANIADSVGRLMVAPSVNQYATYGAQTRFTDPAGHHLNWLAGGQVNLNNGFEITPSTMPGGSTFTTPALRAESAGVEGGGGLPTTSSGTVTPGMSNNGFEVTGSTSFPVTITFANSGFLHKVACVCNDETAARTLSTTVSAAGCVVAGGSRNDSFNCVAF
jgi:hypothetical protein